jgi:hypothetical protein
MLRQKHADTPSSYTSNDEISEISLFETLQFTNTALRSKA